MAGVVVNGESVRSGRYELPSAAVVSRDAIVRGLLSRHEPAAVIFQFGEAW